MITVQHASKKCCMICGAFNDSGWFCWVLQKNLFICLSWFFFIPTVTTLLWIIRCPFHVLLGLFFLMSLLEHYFFIFKVKVKIGRSLQFNCYKSLCEFPLVFVYMHRFAGFCSFFFFFMFCVYDPVNVFTFLSLFVYASLFIVHACVRAYVSWWSCSGVYLNR